MLNYNNSTQFIRIFNRYKLLSIDNLSISIEGRRVLECKVISISPRYIYFDIKDIKILQTGRVEYSLIADNSIIDRGIINLDFSTKILTSSNEIINYGPRQ